MIKKILSCSFFIASIYYANAQQVFQRDSVDVVIAGKQLKNAWAGGLNFCQFSNIDLNQDGIKDLMVFDRTGNKVNTFINLGIPGASSYVYAPQYRDKFPKNLRYWCLLVDYNCDGKEDLFTYSAIGGGIAIYKNTSTQLGGLSFALVNPFVHSNYSPTLSLNLYVSSVDIPAIVDLDDDGDLDILTFGVVGTTVEYHQNQSMELYGNCDSIKYKVVNTCWGEFMENVFNNHVTLGVICKGITTPTDWDSVAAGSNRHSGSSVLAFDNDGDGDKDLVLGDISFGNLVFLTNGGDDTSATMISQDTAFPSYDVPLDLPIFPASFYLDVNNDSIKDLLVSPNEANLCENFNSAWYYKNTGANDSPRFEFQQKNFLQDEMIDVGEGAYPVFVDYNGDGLKDLVIGNYGYFDPITNDHFASLTLFKNTGTISTPSFELVTRDYQNLSSLHLKNIIPTFGDLDNDGDLDMIIGENTGKLHYFKNTASPGDSLDLVLFSPNLQNIDVGECASPQLMDVDRDGKLDLLVGNKRGYLDYFRNIGTTSAFSFDTLIQKLGNVDVSKTGYFTGYNNPFLYDNNGTYNLFVGSERGTLFAYNEIDSNLTGNFNRLDTAFDHIYEGSRISVNGADINNDNFVDLAIGNYAGGVTIYKGTSLVLQIGITEESQNLQLNVDVYPNPAQNSLSVSMKENTGLKLKLVFFNSLGKEVLRAEFHGPGGTVNVSSLAPGLYFCKAQSGKLIANKKIVIIR